MNNFEGRGLQILPSRNLSINLECGDGSMYSTIPLLDIGHCKSILPIWNKLGKKYKDSKAVAVAKMDGTENELENLTLKGFPTIKLYRKGTNEILDYSSRKCPGICRTLTR